MQAQSHGLISRSSSATLSFVERPSYVPPGSSDDLVITRSLLDGPRNLSKRTSFHGIPADVLNFNGSAGQDDSSDSQNTVPLVGRNRRKFGTSNTWTSSSGEIPSEQDEIDDRIAFVHEYNRLAKKHSVRSMIVEDFPSDNFDSYGKAGSWFSRNILRRTSSSQSIRLKTDRTLKHKRSISDLSLRLKSKHDRLKDKDLQELIRLCGSSLLYLPSEYAVGSLAVPTCFRATAQHLVQHAPTARGVFRIPGSHGTVSLLYNHFCSFDDGGDVVSGTVRCPTLPDHIPCDVHDVASAFKKFISGLPGGILGSLRLFDALISIQTQMQSDPELTRTKQSKVRARLIALAIFTLKSQYRRDLICTVFGLLCMIGRAAEISKREDERGRPLPTSDLMGYGPLGIVFGPLLVGDLLEMYSMRLANPRGGLILLPISPPKSRKERKKEKQSKAKTEDGNLSLNSFVDKIKVANGITEMLITHWREVVRHMRNLKAIKPLTSHKSLAVLGTARPMLRPSASETFAIRKPPDWDHLEHPKPDEYASPTPAGRKSIHNFSQSGKDIEAQKQGLSNTRKQGPTNRPLSNNLPTGTRSMSILSPTKERSREELGEMNEIPSTQELELRGKRKENERGSISSRHSRLSRKGESSETPSKLRKPRPPQTVKEINLTISKTRNKDVTDSPLFKLNKSTNDKSNIGSASKNPQGSLLNQKPLSPVIRLGLLSDTSRLLRTSTVTRDSNDVHIPKGMVSRQIRRIAASEPIENVLSVGSPRRIASKSIHVDSSGRAKVFHRNRPKDPLSSVSNIEDLASLQALARVIGYENIRTISKELDGTSATLSQRESLIEIKPTQADELQRTASQKEFTDISSSTTKQPTQMKSWDRDSSTPSIQSIAADLTKTLCPAILFTQTHAAQETKYLSSESNIRNSPLSSAPKHMLNNSPTKRFGSPNHSVKALAAKFNTAESTNVFESPTKTQQSKVLARHGSPYQLRKDNLLGQYTINTPSPTRSQKSFILERSNRRPLGEFVPMSRPVNASPRKGGTPKGSSSGSRSRQSSIIEPSSSVKLEHGMGYSYPASKFLGDIARTFDGHASFQTDRQGSQSLPVTKQNISDKSIDIEQTESVETVSEAASNKLLEYTKSPHIHFASINFDSDGTTTIDQVGAEGDVGEVLSDMDLDLNQPPHLNLQSIASNSGNHQPSSTIPSPTLPIQGPSDPPPLTRRTSILNPQLINLQKQLTLKTEEIRHLKQQLDARANLDIGTLSEQLREAKRECLAWKTRAEISEKQVEMLSKRSIVGRKGSFRVAVKEVVEDEVVGERVSVGEVVEMVGLGASEKSAMRRGLCEMDGAGGVSRDWNSDETTGTVVHVVTGGDGRVESEYGSGWLAEA